MHALPALGDLEVAVLEYIWNQPEASAKDAHAAIGKERGISLNTVQSTLERLHRKEFLERVKVGHSYRYSARLDRAEFVAAMVRDIVGRFGGDSSAALAAFMDVADIPDDEVLRTIEEKLQRRGPKRTRS